MERYQMIHGFKFVYPVRVGLNSIVPWLVGKAVLRGPVGVDIVRLILDFNYETVLEYVFMLWW